MDKKHYLILAGLALAGFAIGIFARGVTDHKGLTTATP